MNISQNVSKLVPAIGALLVPLLVCLGGCVDSSATSQSPAPREAGANAASRRTSQSLSPDPVLRRVWIGSEPSSATCRTFGKSLSAAGDVNGDGYDDVVIGAPCPGGASSSRGMAYLYLGTSSGLSSSPAWSAGNGLEQTENFGFAVDAAGDVNGDGYDDVIVGDPGFGWGFMQTYSKAYVYLGSQSGLSSTPDWVVDEPLAGFGFAVAGGGDLNGDGYDDVAVTALGDVKYSQCEDEQVFVYLGSSSGLSDTPSWTKTTAQSGSCFGWRLAIDADGNGDGFDELVIAAPYHDNGPNSARGTLFVFAGAAGGLRSSADWVIPNPNSSRGIGFGYSLSTAGDVNGDGYDDIFVLGQSRYQMEEVSPWVSLFHGSASGYNPNPDWRRPYPTIFPQAHDLAGGGDVDGDGYDDIALSNWSEYSTLHQGSATGVIDPPAWIEPSRPAPGSVWSVAIAGDVNGDGYDDILVGARALQAPVYLLVGAPNPPPVALAQSVQVVQGSSVEVTLAGSDLHDDPLTFGVVSQPQHGTLGGLIPETGTLTYTVEASYEGADTFEFSAADPYQNSDTATVDVTVLPNHPPHFVDPTPQGSLSVSAGEELHFTIRASDPDGQTLEYSVAPRPPDSEIDRISGEFRWTPPADQVGVQPLTLLADDGVDRISRDLGVVVETPAQGDTGIDTGADNELDAGADTSTVPPDAGSDATSQPRVDVGPDADSTSGARGESSRESGCGCTGPEAPPTGAAGLFLFFAGAALVVIRRASTARR